MRQLYPEKRDSLHLRELALFPVDLKPQLAGVAEHHVPVFTQLGPKLSQYEPVVEIIENANALLPHGNKVCLHDLCEDASQQGQPKGEDFVLVCPSLKCNEQERPVSREN